MYLFSFLFELKLLFLKGRGPGSEKDVECVARHLITLLQQNLDGASANPSPRAATDLSPPPRAAAVFNASSRAATTMQTSVSSGVQRSFNSLNLQFHRNTHTHTQFGNLIHCIGLEQPCRVVSMNRTE